MSDAGLVLVPAADARKAWDRMIRPVATVLGFKPGKTVMRGWIRDAPVRVTFWFQVTMFGFDKNSGWKFIVEFTASDPARQTALRDRLWRLLDDRARREVMHINNDVVRSLPGPSDAILGALPQDLRQTYLDSFKSTPEPRIHNDVWFRYATVADVDRWGAFVAAQLPPAVAECEHRLADLPAGSQTMGGVLVKSFNSPEL